MTSKKRYRYLYTFGLLNKSIATLAVALALAIGLKLAFLLSPTLRLRLTVDALLNDADRGGKLVSRAAARTYEGYRSMAAKHERDQE